MKASEWLRRAKTRNDPADRFGNLWRGFNNLYAPYSGSNERDRIAQLLRTTVSEVDAATILDPNSKSVEYLVSTPVRDMRGNGRDTSPYIARYAKAGGALDRLVALSGIIYQVRCNLEHGQKSPSRKRDIELCHHSSEVLQSIMDRCLD